MPSLYASPRDVEISTLSVTPKLKAVKDQIGQMGVGDPVIICYSERYGGLGCQNLWSAELKLERIQKTPDEPFVYKMNASELKKIKEFGVNYTFAALDTGRYTVFGDVPRDGFTFQVKSDDMKKVLQEK